MSSRAYIYRREDDGELVSVDFETAINQDAAGFITLPDGVAAKREHTTDFTRPAEKRGELPFLPVSDALGFTASQLPEMEADRQRHGFTGVEFTPDPMVPGFLQVRFSSRDEWERYTKHRGFEDKHKKAGGGVMLTERDFDDARELIERKLGVAS